jgi:type II secretory pathway component PulM
MIQITRRERLLGLGLTVVIAIWAFYALALKPARERIRTLQRVIPEKQAELRDLHAKSVEYLTLQKASRKLQAKLASQDPDFQLSPFLETMAERHKLTGHLVTMQPDIVQSGPNYSEEVVTMELHEISLKQLVDFLVAVESSPAVIQVGSLHIRKDPANEALLDITIGIYSPRLGQQPPGRRLAQN